jgi:uncharacterized protein YjbJ (UPF0337 family)
LAKGQNPRIESAQTAFFAGGWVALSPSLGQREWKGDQVDKDRIKGSAKQAMGALKEAAGKLTGDAKLKAEGRADAAAGKAQNAVGGLKDALRGK